MADRIWFITGASRGLGRSFTQAALAAGDRVAATARNASSLDDLTAEYGDAILPVALDVTDRDAAFATVRQVHEHFGRIDVVVNNAGYGVSAAIESSRSSKRASSSKSTCSVRCGSRRPRCRSCASRGRDGSSRSPRSVGWPRSR